MKINTFLLCLFSLVACKQILADGDGFAGGLVGGLTGGMVAGAMNGGNRRDRDIQEVRNREHEKEIDALRREKEQESIEQVRRALDDQKGSSVIYILFFVVFCLMIGLGFLGFMVFRR